MASGTPSSTGKSFRRSSRTGKSAVLTPLTQRRYTPYSKSVQRASVQTAAPLPTQNLKQSRRNDQLHSKLSKQTKPFVPSEGISSLIVGKTWRVYRVSPLYRLQFDKKAFKLYERELSAWLIGEAGGAKNKVKTKTSFRRVEGDSNGEYGVEIKLFSDNGKENGHKEDPELIAVLCCGRKNEGMIKETTPELKNVNWTFTNDKTDFVLLPVCLIKGPVVLKDCFLQWFEGQFGCRVSPLLFSPIDLAWLVSLCSGIGMPTHSTELTYQVPSIVHGLDTICFNIVAKDAKLIWDSIHTSCNEFFTSEEAFFFLQSLESHFYHHFKIHLDQMHLTMVGTSVGFFGQEGKLKITQKNFVCYILQQLAQMANICRHGM